MMDIIKELKHHRIWVESQGTKGVKLCLDEVDLRRVDFTSYLLAQSSILECNFSNETLEDIDFHLSRLCSSIFGKSEILSCDFYKSDLRYCEFSESIIKKSRFSKCDLWETIFTGSRFYECNLVNTNCYKTDFRNTLLEKVDISNAVVERVLMKGAKFKGLIGLDEAHIISIDIGSEEESIILDKDEAKKWIMSMSN